MNGYQHLGLVERRQIYQLAATGRSVHQIAASRQRHRSTIYRELKRNQHLDDEPVFRGYFPTAAQTMAARRRVRGSKIVRSPSLPPISPTACQQPGRRSRLQDIFDAIAVIVKPSVTRPSTSSSMDRTDAARACGAFCLLPVDLDVNAMRVSPAVCISPWPTPLANALPKSVIAAALVIGKAT